MMQLPSRIKFARQNIVVLAGCLAALLVFAGVALLPDIYKHRHLTMAIREAQVRLNEQNDLNALQQKLQAKLALLDTMDAEPLVKPEPLSSRETDQIVSTLQQLADMEGVVVDEVRPAMENGKLPLHRFCIQAVLHGALEQHRALLLNLLREPYVDAIEQLTLEANGTDITLRIILAINIA